MTDHLTSFFPAGRDRGVTVVVEGFFAFVWFGWGQAAPPSWLVAPLAVGDGLAVLLTVAGVVLTTRSAGPLRVMADPAVRRRYSIIVGLEFGLHGHRGRGGLCLLAFGLATLLTAWRRPAVKIEIAPSLPRSVRWLTVASISTGRASMSELWRKGAVELAAMIRDREVSSREVVQAHLDRIEAVNPHLNAIVRLLPDQALAAADAADRAVADGARLGPLHGVPFTVKENIDLAGTPTTQAVPALAEAVAAVDAPQVERLRAVGAIPIGRTNLPDFGLRVHTDSWLHGLTRNPWNPERTAGGSSGGEAAALATGMTPLGLGNDLGGSLRNPAHCCGVASIKPSTGAVPSATVIPPEDWNISFQLMAVEGVLARRIADVRAGFSVVAGQHPRDPLSVPAVFTDLDPENPGERPAVAVLPEPPGGSTHPEVAAAVRRAADALADDGFKVTEAVPPDYEQAIELWSTILTADLRVMKPILDQVMGPGGLQFLGYALDYLPESDVAGWAMAHTARHGLARRWSLWYQEYPVLLSPVWTQPAFPLDFDIASLDNAIATLELMRPVLPANLLGTPAAVVPAGMAEGLPVGIQVMGGKYTELRCLAVAEAIEQRLGTLTPIDPVAG